MAGFSKAMQEFPLAFCERFRRAAWTKLEEAGIDPAKIGRWQAYAIDGSIQNIPRTQAHEEEYGISTKGTSSGALVGEREQSLKLMSRLPESALRVFDAGLSGYEWAKCITEMGRFFLVRVGGNVRLWVEGLNKATSAEWCDGEL